MNGKIGYFLMHRRYVKVLDIQVLSYGYGCIISYAEWFAK